MSISGLPGRLRGMETRAGTAAPLPKEYPHESLAENQPVPVVRRPGRSRREVLHRDLQELEDHADRALHGGGQGTPPQAAGVGDDRGIRARRSAVHRPERRPDIQVQRGYFAADLLRKPAGSGPLLGQAHCRRPGTALWLAQGQVRCLLAGGADGAHRHGDRSGRGKGEARHGGHVPDEEDRYRGGTARLRPADATQPRSGQGRPAPRPAGPVIRRTRSCGTRCCFAAARAENLRRETPCGACAGPSCGRCRGT